MAEFKIPTDQYTKYKKSVHAKALYDRQDLSAPTCNDCHGNHGAAPPGIASVANVCGQCHARQAELFQASVHKAAFDNKGLGECITCHSNHDIARADRSVDWHWRKVQSASLVTSRARRVLSSAGEHARRMIDGFWRESTSHSRSSTGLNGRAWRVSTGPSLICARPLTASLMPAF